MLRNDDRNRAVLFQPIHNEEKPSFSTLVYSRLVSLNLPMRESRIGAGFVVRSAPLAWVSVRNPDRTPEQFGYIPHGLGPAMSGGNNPSAV